MDPKRKRTLIAATALTSLSTGLAIVLGFGIYQNLGLQTVQGAHWYEEGGRASILVSGNRYESPDTGESYYRFGWRMFDVETGESHHAAWYARSTGFPVGEGAPKVLGVIGHQVVYLGDEGIETRATADGTGHGLDSLAARFPNIARPWFSSRFVPPRYLMVESDDRRKYRIDLGSRSAADITDAPPNYDPPACNGLDWPQPDGWVWTFVEAPPARHSDPNRYALARAHRVEYGQLRDVTNLDLRTTFAMVPCDGHGDGVVLFPDGSVLLTIWSGTPRRVGFAKLGTDQRIAWQWLSEVEPDPNLVVRAFSHRGGAIVVVGSTITSLGPDGRVRWHQAI